MFRGTNSVRALVKFTLADGRAETVSLKMPLSSKLHDALNGPDLFLDVADAAGRPYFLAKAEIRRAELVEVPQADQMQLRRRATDRDGFDPYQVLGIQREATVQAIHDAYHAKVRTYHPDRFASIELPREMKDYAEAMLVRINLAYEQIGS
jgi:hypothetical protein